MDIRPLGGAGNIKGGEPIQKTRSAHESPMPSESFTMDGSLRKSETTAPHLAKQAGESGGPLESGRASAFEISGDAVTPLHKAEDGGYLLDSDSGTRIYCGEDALRYLKEVTTFDRETEVILPAGTSLDVKPRGAFNLRLSEPGAVLLGKGAEAEVTCLEGTPVVVTTERHPKWYAALRPEGEMKEQFEQLAGINKKLFALKTYRDRFSGDQLKTLLNYGIVKVDEQNNHFVTWATFRTHEELDSKLIECGFGGKDVSQISSIWERTMKKKLYALSGGSFQTDAISPGTLRKLTAGGIAKEFGGARPFCIWTDVYSEAELKDRMTRAGIGEDEAAQALSLWKKTTKAGYDNTGLAWEQGKVVAYVHRDKANMWNDENTEWIVNSTQYGGENGPFCTGVSHVQAAETYHEPSSFKCIRPAESLHRHPVREEKKQTEVYLVTGGKGVLVSMQKGSPQLTFLKEGDLAVISPDVPHCVMAMQGDYEHICLQVPSAFQYGFLFKEGQSFESFGTDEKTILDAAFRGLRENRAGTCALRDLAR